MMMDELTSKMHYEFLSDEVSYFDLRVASVYGAIKRGILKEKALIQYELTEQEYEDNIDRVLNDNSW